MRHGHHKSNKRCLRTTALCMAIATAAVTMPPRAAQASALGEENAFLAKLVGLEMREIVQLTTLLANIKLILEGVNDAAALGRRAYAAYQMIKNYSVDDLIRDAKAGMYEAFPELKDIETEYATLKKNGDAADDGTFFTRYDDHDRRMNKVMDAGFRHAYRATIWPAVFGRALDENKVSRGPVDDLIRAHFKLAKLDSRAALQETALGILAQKAGALLKDGEDKNRTDLQAQALAAQLAVQNLNNTTRMRDLAEVEVAVRTNEKQKTEQFDAAAREAMIAQVRTLLRPGGPVP